MICVLPRPHFLPSPEHRRLTGKGATVLLLDSGINAAGILSNDFTPLSPLRSDAANAHSFQVASICGDALPAGNPIGLAPAARFFSFDREQLRPEAFLPTLRSVIEQSGPLDIICVAWSAPATDDLAKRGNAWAAELSRQGTLIVAAAGHDGQGRVRMPALWRDVLAVGVHDEALIAKAQCSRSAAFAKPEIFVPDLGIMARDHAGERVPMWGTSAAVSVVAGLAALHVEWLAAQGRQGSAALLKASLLSATKAMSSGPGRALARERLFSEPTWLHVEEEGLRDREAHFVFDDVGGRQCTIAIVALSAHEESRFLSSAPTIEATLIGTRDHLSASSSAGHLVLDLPYGWSGPFEMRLRVSGAHGSVGVVVQGANQHCKPLRRAVGREPVTIGIAASHHASACILVGREVRRAIQLERLSRHKADGEPFLDSEAAAHYCLDSLGLNRLDVDRFAYNCQPVLPGWTGLSRPLATSRFGLFDPYDANALFVSHHLAHAFAAYCASPFQTAVVIVADGAGGGVIGPEGDLLLDGLAMRNYLQRDADGLPGIHVFSIYRFDPGGYRLIHREHAASFNPRCGSSSLGETYAAVSQYIFGNWLDGGKLMGLAPYGNPNAQPSFLVRNASGDLVFDAKWKLAHCDQGIGDPLSQADLAARVQADIEEALVERMRKAVKAAGCRNLVFTGGIALNCVANERIRQESGCAEAFYFPASNDAGIAIGAAQAAIFHRTGTTRGALTPWCEFLGHPYDDRDYEVAMEDWRDAITIEPYACADLAHRLVEGWVIAWFEGASEFGPRALGHRSILASPRSKDTWRFINRRVKGREDFRPFAPIVAEEHAATYFELREASPYMLRVVQIRDRYRDLLGAVCHIDGSARVQTLAASVTPRLHALLLELDRQAHPPILLNTSLNIGGEPIVETPAEAIRLLLTTPLDALVLGRFVLKRRAPPAGLLTMRSVLSLAPHVRILQEDRRHSRRYQIASDLMPTSIDVDECAHAVLAGLDGARSLSAIVSCQIRAANSSALLPLIIALRSKGLLVYHGEHSS